jgi:hypothetical protein
LDPYNYQLIDPGYYLFGTNNGAVYRCYFTSYEIFFSEYPRIAPHIFGFTLQLITSPVRTGTDKRIANTVVTIIHAFLSGKNAVVYVCDYSDNLQQQRFQIFTRWFRQYNNNEIIQLKGRIRYEEAELYNAMLIHEKNPLKNEFIAAFREINHGNDK